MMRGRGYESDGGKCCEDSFQLLMGVEEEGQGRGLSRWRYWRRRTTLLFLAKASVMHRRHCTSWKGEELDAGV